MKEMTMADGTEQSTFATISQMKSSRQAHTQNSLCGGGWWTSAFIHIIYVWFSKPYYKNQTINITVT